MFALEFLLVKRSGEYACVMIYDLNFECICASRCLSLIVGRAAGYRDVCEVPGWKYAVNSQKVLLH